MGEAAGVVVAAPLVDRTLVELAGHVAEMPGWGSMTIAQDELDLKPGAYEVYEFKIDGRTLSLTQRRNVRGPVENGATRTLTRVE